MNFKVPQPDDEFDYYGNSSQDESRGSQGRPFFYFFYFYNSKLSAPLFLFMCLQNWWLKELGLMSF